MSDVESKNGGTVLHEWSLASNMKVRVTLQTYRGRRVLDVRKFYESQDGLFLPTRKGIALEFTAENVGELEAGIRKARAEIEKTVHNT